MKKISVLSLFLLLLCAFQAMGDNISGPNDFKEKFENSTNILNIVNDIVLDNTQPFWNAHGGSKTIKGNGNILGGSGDCGLKIRNEYIWLFSSHQNLDIYNLSINNMKHSDGAVYLVSENNNKNTGLNLENVSFDGNNRAIKTEASKGKNIRIEASGEMNFTNNTFSGAGGAVFLSDKSGADFKNGTMTFSGNRADGDSGRGGAIYAHGSESGISFMSSAVTFSNNTAGGAGGAAALDASAQLKIIFSDIIFENNIASGDSGGAIYLSNRSSFDVNAGTVAFKNNSSAAGGGAAALYDSSVFSAKDSIFAFQENISAQGGALYAANNSVLEFTNSMLKFDKNKSMSAGGGAVYLEFAGAKFTGGMVQAYENQALSGGFGGFLYIKNRNIGFENATVHIASNTASAGGGIYSSGAAGVSFRSSDVLFEYNIAGGTDAVRSGGAIYSYNSEYNFNASAVSFLGNKSENGSGGAIYANNTRMTFTGSTVSFTSNIIESGNGSGGAISLLADAAGKSKMDFINSGIVFSGNAVTQGWGGAISFSTADINFTGGKDIAFYDNSALAGRGGAVYAGGGASMNFSGSENVTFAGNKAAAGGAIYADADSLIKFSNVEKLAFSGNCVSGSGGAIYLQNASSADFSATALTAAGNKSENGSGGFLYTESSDQTGFGAVILISNTAKTDGGAIAAGRAAKLLFSGTDSDISYNKAGRNGGAVSLAAGASAAFSGDSFKASGNSAYNGGFLYCDGARVRFEKRALFFGNESRDKGGAAYITNNSDVSFTDAVFDGNRSSGLGGAVYAESSVVTFKTNADKKTVFKNNSGLNGGDAVYAGDNSTVIFNNENGGATEMYDAIAGSGKNARFIFRGGGRFNLYMNSFSNYADIINEGNFNLKNEAGLKAGQIENKSVVNINNGFKNIIEAKNFSSSGEIRMDIFSSENSSDRIIVEENVLLDSSTSVLKTFIDSSDDNFRRKTFKLISYRGRVNGKFSSVSVSGIDLSTTTTITDNPKIHYGDLFDNWITLTLYGKNIKTDFSSIQGLSFNQKQTAAVYDELSDIVKENEDMDIVISLIESAKDAQKRKNALSQSAGYFLANVIRSGGNVFESAEIYDRIAKESDDENTKKGIWARGRANASENGADDNSLKNYADKVAGVAAGYDMFLGSGDMLLGICGKFNKHDISQDKDNSADVINAAAGLYGGYIRSGWELKALLSASFDNCDTERSLPFFGRKTKASFSAVTVDADIEGAVKMRLADDTGLRYYAGMRIRNSNYGEIKESGAKSLDLIVLQDAYQRISARAGVGINRRKESAGWHINGEYKILFTGNLPEIRSKFAGSGKIFAARGSEEGINAFGVNAGGYMRLTPALKLFTGTGFYAADKYRNIYGNIGLSLSFRAGAFAEKPGRRDMETKKHAEEDVYDADDGALTAGGENAKLPEETEKEAAGQTARERNFSEISGEQSGIALEKKLKEERKKIKEEQKQIDAQIKAYEKEYLKAQKAKPKKEKSQKKIEIFPRDGGVNDGSVDVSATKPDNAKIIEYEIMLAEQQKSEEAKRMAEKEKVRQEEIRSMRIKNTREQSERKSKTSGEISDEELAKKKKEAEDRMLKPVIESFEVRFMPEKYDLSPHWTIELGKQSGAVKKYEYKKISIEGHADSTEKTPKKLSRLRARAVYDEFLRNGIPPEKMSYTGLSSVLPAASNEDEAGRMANRRVVIVIE